MVKSFIRLIQSKYLGIHLDYFTWKHQTTNVAIKLNKANAMLSKIRIYVDIKTLKSIFHAILESHLSYASLGAKLIIC